ncbi:hypothetical protein [Oceanicella sp. SM1341]|uniref:hypothetical protein n=1 Tax=Oceanicella sp. SM1341 TaxID=1548889 RepID=UPI000E4CD8BE|nr:hypothetical protein [Oceanicella sp. SM1341]
MRSLALIATFLLTGASAAGAADLSTTEPGPSLGAAFETCLANADDLQGAVDAFEAAGWKHAELTYEGQPTHEFAQGGVGGMVSPEGGSCRFEAKAVSLDEAKALAGQAVSAAGFESTPGEGECAGPVVETGEASIAVTFGSSGREEACGGQGSSIGFTAD